jgi:dephospho-CoA kinase
MRLSCDKKEMLKVGITGGIGSGKTTICQIFEMLNIPVYYADYQAKWLMQHDPELKNSIINNFGETAYQPDDTLNRAYIAKLVFADKKLLTVLNDLVHPAVFRDSERWFSEQNSHYAIKEAALFYETGSYSQMDKMIVVTANQEERIKRVMQRDGVDRESVLARMDKQLPEEEKIAKADFVIYNDGRGLLIPKIFEIDGVLKKGGAVG